MYKPVVDFIHGLYHSDEFVPLHAPCFIGNEKKYLNECIDTTFVSSVGNLRRWLLIIQEQQRQ